MNRVASLPASAGNGCGHLDLPPGLPETYTTLGSFTEWFRGSGGPMLMYHKLGPTPSGVRLRGLYVATRLFRRQLTELAAEGYRSADPGELLSSAGPGERRMVLTFDDGFENVLRLGLDPLRELGFQAIQFLVPGLLGRTNEWEQREGEVAERLMDDFQVRDWILAGHSIGAHTVNHPHLTRIPIEEAREEIRASRAMLEDRFNVRIRHFCYPFGDWSPAVRDAVAEAGFETACTTEPGLNRPNGDPRCLRRLTARHASRKWRNLGTLLRVWRAAIRRP